MSMIFLTLDDVDGVALACTANDTLSGLGARDGVTPVDGSLCLAPVQTDQTARGLYVARAGAWDRVPMRTGQKFRVVGGTVNGGKEFQLTTGSISPASFTSAGVCATNLAVTDITGGASLPSNAVGGTALSAGAQRLLPFTGRNGAGACTCTGLKVGDTVTGIVNVTDSSNDAAKFEATVTVVNQLQQSDAGDLSAKKFIVLAVAKS